MLILLTSPTYPPFNSGLGNAVAQQAVALADVGHEVVVASGGGERSSRVESDVIRVELFQVSGAWSSLHPIRGDRESYQEFLLSKKWDVVILNAWQNWATDIALQNIERLSGRKYVYSHGLSTNGFFLHQPIRSLIRYINWRPYWWRLPKLINKLDGLIFLNSEGTDNRFDDIKLAKKLHYPSAIISNCLSPFAYIELERKVTPRSRRDRFIAVGSYHWLKGFDFVIKSYAQSSFKNKIPLHLFGQQFSNYTNDLRDLAGRLGILSNMIGFHEAVSTGELMKEYQRAIIILSGSYTECQPLVLIDASAAGTPFIARQTGSIAFMPGGVSVRTHLQMSKSIDDLCNNTQMWQDLSQNSITAANDHYHPLRHKNSLASLVENKLPMILDL